MMAYSNTKTPYWDIICMRVIIWRKDEFDDLDVSKEYM